MENFIFCAVNHGDIITVIVIYKEEIRSDFHFSSATGKRIESVWEAVLEFVFAKMT